MKLSEAREMTDRLESIRLHVVHMEVLMEAVIDMVAQLCERSFQQSAISNQQSEEPQPFTPMSFVDPKDPRTWGKFSTTGDLD